MTERVTRSVTFQITFRTLEMGSSPGLWYSARMVSVAGSPLIMGTFGTRMPLIVL